MLQPIVVIMVQSRSRVTKQAVQFAMSLTKDIKVLHAVEDVPVVCRAARTTESEPPDSGWNVAIGCPC